ncbi:MAG TPA: MFS transporter [Candidatus Acidoferrales bacterium]|nr:MFS transporter [Candidatus Acidoferrales bacterium]
MGGEGRTLGPIASAPKAGKRILLLVSASHASQHMYSALLPLTYSYVLIAFHINYAELGLAVAASSVVGGLSQITAGYVSRRVTARWILGSQNLIVGLCAVLGSLAPTYPLFAGAQGVAQLGASQQHPVGSAVLARTYPDRRGSVLTVHTISGSLGSLLIPLPAAVMLSRLGWRPTMLILSAPLFLMGVILLLTFPVMARPRLRSRLPGRSRLRWPSVPRAEMIHPRVVILGILAATVAAAGRGLGTLNAYVPLFLRNRAHIPEVEVGLIFDLMLLGAVVGPLIGGALSDRLGRLPVIWVAYAVAAVFVFALGRSAGMPLPIIVMLALAVGVFAYIENPLLQALVSDGVTSEGQSSVFGIYFTLAYGVGSLWLALLGWVIGAFGFPAAFSIMAGSYLVAGAVLIPCWKTVRRRAPAEPR